MKKSETGSNPNTETPTPLNSAPEYVEFSDGSRLKVEHHLQFSITEKGVFSCGNFNAAMMGEAIAAMMNECPIVRQSVVMAIAKDMINLESNGERDVVDDIARTANRESNAKSLLPPFRKTGKLPEA